MKQNLKQLAVAAAVFASTTSFAQPAAEKSRTRERAGVHSATVEINYDERGLLERLHELHQREITWAKLARDNASMASTREYAEGIIKDHTAADERVIQVAEARKVKLGHPDFNAREKKMKGFNEATEQLLKDSDGPAFDSAYLATQVVEHDKAIQMMNAAQVRFPGAEIASVTGQVVPRLVGHREQAYRALGEVGQKPGMGGSGKQ